MVLCTHMLPKYENHFSCISLTFPFFIAYECWLNIDIDHSSIYTISCNMDMESQIFDSPFFNSNTVCLLFFITIFL